MSFDQYHEWRELKSFSNKFNQYCEAVALSGKDFDQLWSEEILPVLQVSEGYEDENSLLNEFWGGLKEMFGSQAPNNPGFAPDKNPEMHSWLLKNDPNYAHTHQKTQKLNNFQGKVDQMTADIKSRFVNSMDNFLKMVNDDASKQQNPNMYKIAQKFYQKILAAAQPAIDGFKMNAKYRQPSLSSRNESLRAWNCNSKNEDHIAIAMGKQLDDEGSMILNQLDMIEDSVKKLRSVIKSPDMQLPAWVQAKVTLAVDYMQSTANYMASKNEKT